MLQARTPRFGYRIYFRPQVKGGKERVINFLRQGRREVHSKGLANVSSTLIGSERLIMCGTLSFHWRKEKNILHYSNIRSSSTPGFPKRGCYCTF